LRLLAAHAVKLDPHRLRAVVNPLLEVTTVEDLASNVPRGTKHLPNLALGHTGVQLEQIHFRFDPFLIGSHSRPCAVAEQKDGSQKYEDVCTSPPERFRRDRARR
jgi:hypothetical protein